LNWLKLCKVVLPDPNEEKNDEGARDPFKILLEEALKKQRNAMMDNYA